MENLLFQIASQRFPIVARYTITAVIVAIFFALRVSLAERAGIYGFFVLIPAVFLASLLFDRGSGFFATALSTLALAYLIPPQGSFLVRPEHIAPLGIFVLECAVIAILCEALRKALERATQAERQKHVLFEELAHRTKNNLQLIASVLALQARAQNDPILRQAFDAAVARVQVIANAHSQLQPSGEQGAINLEYYLEDLCRNLGDSLRDLRPVAVRVEAEPIMVGPEKAVPIGLIVNELVTNAFKYAFPDGSEGAIDITLRRLEKNEVELRVRDTGVGCTSLHEGLGSRLVRLLVQQLGGTIAREPAKPGCLVTARLILPSSP